jgi:hypothetical protein
LDGMVAFIVQRPSAGKGLMRNPFPAEAGALNTFRRYGELFPGQLILYPRPYNKNAFLGSSLELTWPIDVSSIYRATEC